MNTLKYLYIALLSFLLISYANADEGTYVYNKALPSVPIVIAKKLKTDKAGFICSGVVISPTGYIATAKHCVGELVAVGIGGKVYEAKVVDIQHFSYDGLALIKIDAKDLPFLKISKDYKIGERVYTIGHPHGYKYLMTQGIISSVYENTNIIIDATVNTGNSGGALLNSDGDVIGIIICTDNDTYKLNNKTKIFVPVGLNTAYSPIKYIDKNN